jgi:hypothetical protein
VNGYWTNYGKHGRPNCLLLHFIQNVLPVSFLNLEHRLKVSVQIDRHVNLVLMMGSGSRGLQLSS